jgi:hypothetical protein
MEPEIDWTPLADARYRAHLRLSLTGRGAALTRLRSRLWFMCSPHSLPALRKAGDNRMRLHAGDEYGLNTRAVRVEDHTDAPAFRDHVHATANLISDPAAYSRLLPRDPSRPWEVVYRIRGPQGERVAWISACTVIEGRKPGEADRGVPAAIEVSRSERGPWIEIASLPIQEHERGWHFYLAGKRAVEGAGPDVYVRFRALKGANYFRIVGHYEVGEVHAPGPLEIEHRWYETDPRVGRRLRKHMERTETTAHEYVVHCQQAPHNDSLVLRAPSARRPEAAQERPRG